MYETHPHQILSDEHFHKLVTDGYVILPSYIRGEELIQLQAAQRNVLTPWDKAKDNPPAGASQAVPYPYPDARMCRLYLHPEIIKLAKRYLKSEELVARVGYMLSRYPGFKSGDTGHYDNGNNSLLPINTAAREYSQIVCWIHLEEVKPGQAPLLLVKHKDGTDLSKAEPLIVPEGSICLFTNYTWHASSPYTLSDGQRFTWGFMIGRADHPFEGLLHYTALGQQPNFNQAVRDMSPRERELFRFPPPNHPYYTKQTLEALEQQYPGWNASGVYRAVE